MGAGKISSLRFVILSFIFGIFADLLQIEGNPTENSNTETSNEDPQNYIVGLTHMLQNEDARNNPGASLSINSLTTSDVNETEDASVSNTLNPFTHKADNLFVTSPVNSEDSLSEGTNTKAPSTGDLISSIHTLYVQLLHSKDFKNSSVPRQDNFERQLFLLSPQTLQKYAEIIEKCQTPQKTPATGKLGPTKYSRLAFLDQMLENYDKRAWPTYNTGEPTLVKVNIYINSLGPVNAANMEYGMDIYLRQKWVDKRLRLNRFNISEVTLNARDIAEKIWKPDLFFRNVKQASFHMVTVPNMLIKLSADGDVLFSMRLTLRLGCQMSFRHYPLDTQHCKLILGSYAQTTDQVEINWLENAILYEDELEIPEFDVIGLNHENFTRDIDTGSFSFIRVTFVLVRQNGFHLIQTYMPTFLIVMISWVSFWLNVDATPARVTLGVTTLLTLTTVAYGVRMQLPPVSYVKAIDIWIGTCSVMVFGALLEFTLVNYLSRSKLRPEEFRNPMNMFYRTKKFNLPQEENQAGSEKAELAKNLKRAQTVDRFCRVVFPLAFFVFNVIYWLYYIYVPDKYAVP